MMTREGWLKERGKGLGASDAAAILGLSPYKTNVALWEEKTGRRVPEDIGGKSYVQYGNNAEQHLRALFALDHPEYELTFEPFKIIRNPSRPFIFATPDGELLERDTGRRGGLEIKTTEIMRSGQLAEWKDKIPDGYFAQICHQMLAAEWEFVVLKAQIKIQIDGLRLDTRHYYIEREDTQKDISYLLQKEIAFWDCVEKDIRPDLLLPAI